MSSHIRLALAVVSLVLAAPAADAAKIPRDQLQAMFDQIARDTDWNLTAPFLWGYFFTNPTRAALDEAASLLAAKGYRVVGVRLAQESSTGAPEIWLLHVERVEVHTVDSLDTRNNELEAFAKAHGIASYDGMDIGPASTQ